MCPPFCLHFPQTIPTIRTVFIGLRLLVILAIHPSVSLPLLTQVLYPNLTNLWIAAQGHDVATGSDAMIRTRFGEGMRLEIQLHIESHL